MADARYQKCGNPSEEGPSLRIYAHEGLMVAFDMMLKGETLVKACLFGSLFFFFFLSKGQPRGGWEVSLIS